MACYGYHNIHFFSSTTERHFFQFVHAIAQQTIYILLTLVGCTFQMKKKIELMCEVKLMSITGPLVRLWF